VAGVDVSHAAAPPGVRAAALFLARLLAQLLVAWIWVLFALSLFPGSRPAADWLLLNALHPAGDLARRLGASLPGLVGVAILAILALAAVRTLRLLFDQAARGEATLPLVSRDRAQALGRVLRALVVLLAVLLAAPLVAGGEGNALGRVGEAALLAVALALVPLAANTLAGLPVLLGRSLQLGEQVEVAGRAGHVIAFGALGLELVDSAGGRTTVPWLLTLLHPLRRLPPAPRDGSAPP
jgi:small-conductance mechanosensitive channel